jgi:SAM-dependent methyltransferase
MNPTRGLGKLEGIISKGRMSKVMKNIHPDLYHGEVLDIGCGTYPLFLLRSPFSRKVGVDQVQSMLFPDAEDASAALELHQLSLTGNIRLPFPDISFGCVTSLACIEHLEPESLPSLFKEVYRVLKPNGMVLMTTPHAIADKPLRLMASLGLVSKEEIDEHKSLFHHQHIFDLFLKSGFTKNQITVTGFQFGMNILGIAFKSGDPHMLNSRQIK